METAPKVQQRSERSLSVLRRRWGDFDVVDATHDLLLFVQKDDIENAKRKAPGECALAKCAMRLIGSARAAFFRNTAYVEHPDTSGRRKVYRYQYPKLTRKFVADFDLGKSVPENLQIRLMPPTPSEKLESKRRYSAKWAARNREKKKKRDLEYFHRRKAEKASGLQLFEDAIFIEGGVRSGTGRAPRPS